MGLVGNLLFTKEELLLVVSGNLILNAPQLVLEMIFQLSRSVKLTPAVVTPKLPIFIVPSHVVLQMTFGNKVLGANLALIVSMTIVRLQVHV
jgi:hypothetical protein